MSGDIDIKKLRVLLGLEADKYKRDIDESRKKTNDFKKEISDISGTLLKVGAGLAATAVIAKAAFEYGEEGAQIKQLTASFNGLMDQIGASPAILEDMRRSVNYTVDDMTLMSSSQTMLAGTSGNVAKAFSDALPDLALFAKAANKLNPELGDTTFLMESLATGIKRGQKQIIDNLGITFSLSEAYADYAASVGKSVEALSDEDKTLAVLAKTREKGQILLEQAGGTVESATDAYAAFNTEMKNSLDQTKVLIHEGVEPLIKKYLELREAQTKLLDESDKIDESYKKGIISARDYELATGRAAHGGVMPLTDATEDGVRALERYELMNDRAALEMQAMESAARTLSPAIIEANKQTEIGASTYWEYITAVREGAEAGNEMAEATNGVATAILNVSKAALGKEAIDGLNQAFTEGKISPEQYADMVEEVAVNMLEMPLAQAEAAIALGRIKKDFEDGKIPIDGYLQDLYGISTTLGDLNGKTFRTRYELNIIQSGGSLGFEPEFQPRAAGGRAEAGQPYWIGEQGPEPFIPDTSGYILNAQDAKEALAASGGGNTYQFMITNPVQNAEQLYREFKRLLDNDVRTGRNAGVQYANS